jgi:fructosamine-3-kinase
MFEKEANGLNALRDVSNCHVPEVIQCGVVEGTQFLLLGWLEKGIPGKDFWKTFGTALAHLHQRTNTDFGFNENNYIGSLPQIIAYKSSWGIFYGENRIIPLINRLIDSHSIGASELKSAESLCDKLDDIFPNEMPALLHGDLWSGNFMIVNDGKPALYDPAVYFGHREMDLGMTKLFGGFDSKFYESYNEVFPLEKDWQSRIELTQLYPLLVHAILFGGGYVQRVLSIIHRFG